jgi:MerR family mercuric resistance operon transcriptional regulator
MPKITKSRGYAIGEVSRLTGVNIETVRYYERIELLPKPDRTAGGNRQYNQDQLKQLFFIKRARELGFSIREIRGLLAMALNTEFTCAEVHDITIEHLTSVQEKITSLQRLEAVLKDMAAECGRGDVPDCPILDTLFEVGSF